MTNILLVDDERILVEAIARLLRRGPYVIYTAENALQAQQLLCSQPIDLIVSDQTMPGMCGVELLGWAARHFPDTVRILLTGWTTVGNPDQAVTHALIDRCLVKPCTYDDLRSAIQDELRVRHTSSQRVV